MDIPAEKKQAIMDAIYGGAPRKIEAIKLVREASGCGLAEAKEYVEKLSAELYSKEPGKFKASPHSKGCMGLVVGLALIVTTLAVAKKVLCVTPPVPPPPS